MKREMTENEKEYRKRYTKTHWMLYAYTFNGYTGKMYYGMQHRVRTQYASRNFKVLFTLKEFRQFLLKNDFQSIYDRYLESGRKRRLAPSIDRIDNKKGYFFENMQLITQVENARNKCKECGGRTMTKSGLAIHKGIKHRVESFKA